MKLMVFLDATKIVQAERNGKKNPFFSCFSEAQPILPDTSGSRER